MPDIDGLETTRRIRDKVGRDTPIIIISAYDWSEIEEEARAAGANAFIMKPLFQSSLYNTLVSVTNGAFGMSRSKEAVDQFSESEPGYFDAILMDVQMPDASRLSQLLPMRFRKMYLRY
ncbi:response regulator [Diplocloster modestus]|nr:response regulator [Diplocloster modestus]